MLEFRVSNFLRVVSNCVCKALKLSKWEEYFSDWVRFFVSLYSKRLGKLEHILGEENGCISDFKGSF